MSNVLTDAASTRKVIVACGTGGVGKTSCAAAIGLLAARSGRRAVVLTIDPARRLADAIGLGGTVANEPVLVPTQTAGELWVCMLDVQATFDGLVIATSRDEAQARRVLDNTFYRGLSNSLSGTRDYMAAERLHSLSRDPRFDIVIVDTPPSRSALDFLESPEKLARFLSNPVVKVLSAQGRGGLRIAGAAVQPVVKAIGKVVGNDALSGAISFLQSFGGMEQVFAEKALQVARLLRSAETSFVVVASPSRDAVEEAGWFVNELRRMGIDLPVVIENRVPPDFGPAAADDFPDLAAEHAAAADVLGILRERTLAVHPGAGFVRATESPGDIHDLDGVSRLADEIGAG